MSVRGLSGSNSQFSTMNLGWTTASAGSSKTTLLMGARTLDTVQHVITTNGARTIAMERRWRIVTTSNLNHPGSASRRQLHSCVSLAPLCRLDTPTHSNHLVRHLSQSTTHHSIPLKGASCLAHTMRVQALSQIRTSTTKRSSATSASQLSSTGPASISSSEASSKSSSWQFPGGSAPISRRSRQGDIHLPLPIALKTFKPSPAAPNTTLLVHSHGGSSSTASTQLAFPPPPAVLGSQPLYYLAKKFPILAEHELMMIPNKTGLDYSSFLVGAMSTSYPSATTLRAVVRQFRNFLKESARQLKTTSTTTTAGGVNAVPQVSMELPRARIWAITIRGLIWLKQYRRARVAIYAMQKLGIKPTGYAWRGICRGWIEEGQLDRAEELAVKVFTRPEISHDYRLDERPYYFTDILEDSNSSSGGGRSAARRKHRSPMAPNSAPLFLVIEALAECGEMERARHWFDQIPEHEMTDLLTSDMVAGYVRVGQQEKAQEVIRIMARCGVKPTAIVFNPIVRHAAEHMGMEAAEELVKDMAGLGIFLNLYTYKILARGYIAAGQKDKALKCLDRMQTSGVETDRALGRIFLEGFWEMGELRRGDHGPSAICEMNRTQETKGGLHIEDLSFVGKPGWGQRCIKWIQDRNFEQAEEALHLALNLGPSRFDVEAVHVIIALANKQEMARARHWFNRLMSPECIESYRADGHGQGDSALVDLANCMVSGFIQARQPSDAQAVISTMSQQGIHPTVETTNLILRWSTIQEEMEDAEGLVQRMAQSGISPNQETFEILCQGYASRGSLVSLQDCLTRMEEAGFGGEAQSRSMMEMREYLLGQKPYSSATLPTSMSVFSTPNIIDTLCARWIEQDQVTHAEEFISHLASNPNVPPSMIPYATLIQGWIDQSQRYPVSSNAIQAIKPSPQGPERQSALGSSASSSVPSSESFDQEVRLGQENVIKMRKARFWFDKIPEQERTLDLLNKMIGGYMTLGLEHESEALVHWMASREVKPDVTTYNHTLEHIIQRLNMPTAEGLVRRMRKGGIEPNVGTWNLLIRGYVIRGQLSNALHCLDVMIGKIHDSTAPTSAAAGMGSKSSKFKARKIIEAYDREILDVVVEGDEEIIQQQQLRSVKVDMSFGPVFQPDEVTEQLILSGFGPDLMAPQGQGDSARALELYNNRCARQRQQKEQLLQGLSVLKQHSSTLSSARPGAADEDEDEWILDQFEALQNMEGLAGSEVGMTDLDWKNELKWEEMMEQEKVRERELSGRSNYTY
ncbi:hypothetical protein BG011_008914 [Mortierella polycephala]|uniref:Pentacotripeptide-repeat region of PRORP domain-containing protein n=1 Tax=Mortierella polycephala TaxID=41804 RepID=A0A9P6TX61_9FUNG|nr:hypothetical protein BG011_008914 [Mortierella polycephala]